MTPEVKQGGGSQSLSYFMLLNDVTGYTILNELDFEPLSGVRFSVIQVKCREGQYQVSGDFLFPFM